MSESPRNPAALVVRLIFLAVVIALLVHYVDLRAAAATLRRLSVTTFLGCVALEWCFYAVESRRIRLLSRGRYPYSEIWSSRLLTSFLTSFLPGASFGEVIRIFLLDRTRPGNKLYLALLLLTNRLCGVITLASALLFGLFYYDSVGGVHTGQRWAFAAGGLALLLGPFLLRVGCFRFALVRSIRRLHGRPRVLLGTAYRAMSHFGEPGTWTLAMLSAIATNLIVIIEFWWLGRAMGVQLSLGLWAICVSVSSFAAFLPVGFGAIGSQDASLALIARIVGKPIDPMLAVSVAVHLVRISGTLPGLFYLGKGRAVVSDLWRQRRSKP